MTFRKQKALLIMAVIVVVFFGFAFTNTTAVLSSPMPQLKPTIYTDSMYGFRLELPQNWHIQPASGALGSYTQIRNYDPTSTQPLTSLPIDVIAGVLPTDKPSNVSLSRWLEKPINMQGLVGQTALESSEREIIVERYAGGDLFGEITYWDFDGKIYYFAVTVYDVTDLNKVKEIRQSFQIIKVFNKTQPILERQSTLHASANIQAANLSSLRLPFIGTFTITAGPGCSDTHINESGEAIDFRMPVVGTDILAAHSGQIADASIAWNEGFGNLMKIDHGDGYESWYAHLDSFIKTSGSITRGEHVAESGNSGNSTGAHLHFEVREQAQDQSISIRTLPGISWVSNDPNNPCQPKGVNDGEASGYSVLAGEVEELIIALNAANADSLADEISLAPGSYTLTAIDNSTYGPTGLPVITAPIAIVGNGATITRDSAAPEFRILAVAQNGALTLDNLTISGGSIPNFNPADLNTRSGGGILNLGTLAVRNNSYLTDNRAHGNGGAIFTVGDLNIADSQFESNTAAIGGAVGCQGSQNVNITGSWFISNSATVTTTTAGGAIRCPVLTVSSSHFQGNSAVQDGGAIAMSAGVIETSEFENNESDNGGGAINANGTGTIVRDSIFKNNMSQVGGAIEAHMQSANQSGSLIVENSQFDDNLASVSGGAIYSNNSYITDSEFRGNTARQGGAIHSYGYVQLHVADSTLFDNRVTEESGALGGNIFLNHNLIYNYFLSPTQINNNCIVGTSGQGIYQGGNNPDRPDANATNNWWGVSDGPSGFGTGSGAAVGEFVDYMPFLTAPSAGCPGNDNPIDAPVVAAPQTSSLELATHVASEPTPSCGANVNRSLWYRISSSTQRTLRTQIEGNNWLSVLSVWAGSPGNFNEISCESGANPLAVGAMQTASDSLQLDVIVEPNTTYYIMVASSDEDASSFTLTANLLGLPTEAPVLLSPVHSTTIANLQPTFKWTVPAGAKAYEIQLDPSNPADSLAIRVTQPTYKPLRPLLIGTYYWRVRALNSDGIASGWSEIFTISVESPVHVAPNLHYFSNNPVTLTWGGMSWADQYEIEVSSDFRFNNAPVFSATTQAGTLFVEVIDLRHGAYHWRIRAIQDGVPKAWSATQSFYVNAPQG